jgi:hypothetical protein
MKFTDAIRRSINSGNVFRRLRKIVKTVCYLRHVCPSLCLQCHPTPGSIRSPQLHIMYQSRWATQNFWWWAERLPETCRVVIPMKFEFSASVGLIHFNFNTNWISTSSDWETGSFGLIPEMFLIKLVRARYNRTKICEEAVCSDICSC